MKTSTLDPKALRQAFGTYVTGVTVVTTVDADGQPRGLTANSFTSVSLDPALVMFCIDHKAASYPVFQNCKGFVVNVLTEAQKDVSNLFASKATDKFDHVETRPGVTGAPIIDDALSWFDCTLHDQVEAGDHLILIGEVKDFASRQATPLGYGGGNYITFGLEQTAVKAGNNTQFGCVLGHENKVLLIRDEESNGWTIPLVQAEPGQSEVLSRLPGLLKQIGAEAEISFLYSVYETLDHKTHIVYRGQLTQPELSGSKTTARLFTADELPWDQLCFPQLNAMLRRYFRDCVNDRFGIYTEALGEGSVAMLEGRPEAWGEHKQKINL
ncbi:flavin reductase [Aliamphritea hakodatensis]|uniref:flavin reductase n=1 Tax=Aliamphritea hakodatensis TaxID=2895352 RepID=UPI0022FD4307|nr:flavin reductase [Aliamphritea hakodatensis]